MSIDSKLTNFNQALNESLALEGLSEVKLQHVNVMQSPVTSRFKKAIGFHDATFRTFIATAIGPTGPVKIAGVSTARTSIGVMVEVFIAPTKSFDALGSWVVPTVRYFGLALNEPHADMSVHAKVTDKEAADNIADFFSQWMQYMIMGKDMSVMGTIQTLGIQNGTGF